MSETDTTTTDEEVKSGPVIPPGAKRPEDHKSKGEDDETPEDVVVTIRGVELTIPGDAMDDFELLDDLYELDAKKNPARLPAVMKRLVGDDQWGDIMDALRGPNGRVSVERGAEFVGEVLEAINPNS